MRRFKVSMTSLVFLFWLGIRLASASGLQTLGNMAGEVLGSSPEAMKGLHSEFDGSRALGVRRTLPRVFERAVAVADDLSIRENADADARQREGNDSGKENRDSWTMLGLAVVLLAAAFLMPETALGLGLGGTILLLFALGRFLF